VFRTTARYDALIADELTRLAAAADPAVAAAERLPGEHALPLRKVQDLRYGENPHQSAAFYELRLPGAATLPRARQRHGKELSYNNIMDCDAAWELVKEFAEPACAVIKHTNPCGCAVAADQTAAFAAAWDGDPLAAFGSIVAFNRELDAATADALCADGRFVEAIVAPSFADAAFEAITTRPKWKKNVRLIEVGAIASTPAEARYLKQVLGGVLLQECDRRGWDPDALEVSLGRALETRSLRLEVVTKRAPSDAELADLAVAWPIVKHLKSNAICIVRDRALVGAGAGQMSRVASARIAAAAAGERARGAALASDAFFPFPDGVAAAAAAGVTSIVQPGGSKGDPAVIAEADAHDLAMVFTGVRHFRH